MIVSHRHRFIYLRTEKTASTSLTEALKAVCGPDDLIADMTRPAWSKYSPIHHGALKRTLPQYFGAHVHATAAQVWRLVGRDVWNSYLKFAVERNPWDRQVSLYHHRAWKTKRTPDFDRDMRSAWYRNTEYTRLNNWAIYAIGDEVVTDRILRYEALDQDLTALFEDLGLPKPELGRQRAQYRTEQGDARAHYSTYYSDTTRDLVGRWYKREIAALGYQFEDRRQSEMLPSGTEGAEAA